METMNPDAAAETAALIANLWERQLPTLRERLDILDRISVASAEGPLTKEDREEATSISHKFAGSLGMYGYRRGTEVAMEMENLLRSDKPLDPSILISLTYQLRESIFPTR